MNFPPRMFPGFLEPEALKLSVTPAQQAELVCLSQQCKIASCGSRWIIPLVGVWGEQPQRCSLCLFKIILKTMTAKILGREQYYTAARFKGSHSYSAFFTYSSQNAHSWARPGASS